MRKTREEAAARNQATHNAQAERIEALETRCADLQQRLEDAQSKELPFATGADNGDPDLLPALERFAGLLESCADKLEGRAGNA